MTSMELYGDRKPGHRRSWAWLSIFLAVIFIVLGALLSTTIGKPLGLIGPDSHIEHWIRSTYANSSYGFISIIVFLWVWLFERRGLAAIGLNGKFWIRYSRGLLVGGAMMASLVWVGWALGGFTLEAPGLWNHSGFMVFVPVIALFAAFMIQGASEEIVFRGWLLQVVTSRWGIFLAVIVNAALFAFLHAGNIRPSPELWLGVFNILVDSVFIALYAITEGSIWGVCGQHAIWNWLMGVGFGLNVSGEHEGVTPLFVDLMPRAQAPWWLTGGAFGPEGSIIMTALDMVALGIMLWLFFYKKPKGHAVVTDVTQPS